MAERRASIASSICEPPPVANQPADQRQRRSERRSRSAPPLPTPSPRSLATARAAQAGRSSACRASSARAAARRRCTSRSKSRMPNRSTIQPDGLRTPMNCRERMTRPPMRRVQTSPPPDVSNSTAMAASSVAAGKLEQPGKEAPHRRLRTRQPRSAPANATARIVQRLSGARLAVVGGSERAPIERRTKVDAVLAPAGGDAQAGLPPLGFDFRQRQQAQARHGASERRAARELADQRRRRRDRDEGTVAALGDQAPDAALCAGRAAPRAGRRDPCRESADDRRCAPGAARRAPATAAAGRAPATTATTARHGGSTVPSRRRRRCRECRSVERTARAPAGRRRRPSACPAPAASCGAGRPRHAGPAGRRSACPRRPGSPPPGPGRAARRCRA